MVWVKHSRIDRPGFIQLKVLYGIHRKQELGAVQAESRGTYFCRRTDFYYGLKRLRGLPGSMAMEELQREFTAVSWERWSDTV